MPDIKILTLFKTQSMKKRLFVLENVNIAVSCRDVKLSAFVIAVMAAAAYAFSVEKPVEDDVAVR